MAKKKKKPDTPPMYTGKRRRAVARARIEPGTGIVKINAVPVDLIQNELIRLRVLEPLLLVGDAYKKFNITVNATGGGQLGQADAARQAIARSLVAQLGDEAKKVFLSYDRNLLVYDARRTEPHKPPRSSQGPRRYKQRSKR